MSIAVRPGTFAWDVLRLVVACPGELTVETITLRLAPLPARKMPFANAEDRRQWITFIEQRRREGREKVSRTLGRLVEAGLVAPTAGPRLSPEFARRAERDGLRAALWAFHPEAPNAPTESLGRHLALIRRVEKLPPSARALLGARPSGARQRRYADLVRWEVLVAPQQRWPTSAGEQLVREREAA